MRWWLGLSLVALAASIADCSGGGGGSAGSGAGGSPAGTSSATSTSSGSSGGIADAGNDGPQPTPTLASTAQLCKLENTLAPTANDTWNKWNLAGADLGIPVEHEGRIFIFFGDTIGKVGIWPAGQGPDSVAYAADPATAVAADPTLLCKDLTYFNVPSGQPGVQSDFAGGFMTPPAGHSISEYVHRPAVPSFTNIPGIFEVPSGAFDFQGSIYLFYTTARDNGSAPNSTDMMASYLAEWGPSTPGHPEPGGQPGYQILYQVDERFDTASPLHGHFVNIAGVPSPAGDYLYVFGTGLYRQSPIFLARKPLAALATPGGFEEYDAKADAWAPAGKVAAPGPLVSDQGYGELSVRYFPEITRWVMLAAGIGANVTEIRFADRPEGPWSAPMVLTPQPQYSLQYCCVPDDNCPGTQFMNCDKTGPYGPYLFPFAKTQPDGSFTLVHTMSSFDPYGTALFTATFNL